jgi:glycosyltransferase involved in cell wall biosynthesis
MAPDGPLRILLISYHFAPSDGTGSNRPTALARHLRAKGHTVVVLTTSAHGRLPEDDEVGNVRTYDLQRLQARLHGRSVAEDPSSSATFSTKVHPLSRILVPDAYLLAWTPFALVRALRLVRTSAFDCVLTKSAPESAHFIGQALGRRGTPWIADLGDGWAFEPWIQEEMWPTEAQHRISRWLERRTLTRADAVTTVNAITNYLSRRLGIDAELIPNGWERSTSGTGDGANSFHLDQNRVSAIYTGGIGVYRKDPVPLIRALRTLAQQDPESASRLELVFAGSFTDEEQRLFETDCSPARILNLGRLDRDQVSALQRGADAGILLNARERHQDLGNKLSEYFGARLPMLALAPPESATAEIVGRTGGEVVDTHDDEAIARGLKKLVRGEVPRPDERTAESYSWPVITDRMVEVMREAIERRRPRSDRQPALTGAGTKG